MQSSECVGRLPAKMRFAAQAPDLTVVTLSLHCCHRAKRSYPFAATRASFGIAATGWGIIRRHVADSGGARRGRGNFAL